jgi:exopolyphosphatase / guanosine-5'-triphosphate,3'-diphosphate pyrophosphatase
VRLACVDVGSNTTRLLVAEPIPTGLRGLHNERLFTLIGRSIDPEGRIPAHKVNETAAAVANQAERARRMGAEGVRVVATAAIRRSANAAELAAAVEERAGVPLEVLSGDEEARLAYAGAAQALGGTEGSLAVVDVGGGSTEIAFGDAEGRIVHATSVMIGSSTLADRHLATDPPTPEQIAAARADVAEAFEDLETRPVDHGAAIGGSASSLEHLAGRELGQVEIAEALDLLQRESAWDIGARYELEPERVKLLPAGLLVLEELTRRLRLPLRICKGGLREGVILEMIRNRT